MLGKSSFSNFHMRQTAEEFGWTARESEPNLAAIVSVADESCKCENGIKEYLILQLYNFYSPTGLCHLSE
jgi:hypothetical protein